MQQGQSQIAQHPDYGGNVMPTSHTGGFPWRVQRGRTGGITVNPATAEGPFWFALGSLAPP